MAVHAKNIPNWDNFDTRLLLACLAAPILYGDDEQKKKNIETREAFRVSLRKRGIPESDIPPEPATKQA